jgi:membrane-bound lytic murein transglycosylase D
MKALFSISIFCIATFGIAQDTTVLKKAAVIEEEVNPDSLTYERFLDVVENSLFEYYKDIWGKERAYEVIDSMGFVEADRPIYSDSVYTQRLHKLNTQTIIDIEVNQDVIAAVKYFVRKRRRFTAVCLGRSKLYFPMYEEYLDRYQMPLELKYLSVIESGLRPTVKSRAGATGLWQFMYRTGVMYGLDNDSYVDDRMDPEKATDAACRYLKYLYGLYGDWSIALAAYNAGPGNVNKAIRRSGGQMDYWKLRPFLPQETQMYVPNFICMLYMMNYYAEHNIIPKEAKVYLHETDTVCLKGPIRISHIDSLVGIQAEEFAFLNPTYKTDFIPHTDPGQCIKLPLEKIGAFLDLEDSLYGLDAILDSTGGSFVALEKKVYHYVKTEETIAQIAARYDVTVNDIKGWNQMRKSSVFPGQRLTIMKAERKYIVGGKSTQVASSNTTSTSSSTKKTTAKTYSDGKYKYYTLKSGENLWAVSQKLGIPFARIQELNRDIDPKRMQPGDKIRVSKL